MKATNSSRFLRPVLAAMLPLVAGIVQWIFWSTFRPFVWFLFYPAVFLSSWIGGLSGGLAATIISAPLVVFFFIPPQLAFAVESPENLYSVIVFMAMGVLFSLTHERLRKATRQAHEALEAARHANDQLQEANEKNTTIEFLRLVSESTDTRDLIRKVTSFFEQQSGCDAVGVRLRDGDDYPYFEARGFPPEFVLAENQLCLRNRAGQVIRDNEGNPVLECMCGNVISGRFNPSKSFFTVHGSFWSNSTTELLATTTEADRQARTRNRCNGAGYESVALLPLRLGAQRFGLLQLNDHRKGMFSPETIGFWERLADHLAVALAKFRADDALRASEERFRHTLDNMMEGCQIIDFDWRYIYVNDAAAAQGHCQRAELLGHTMMEMYPGIENTALFAVLRRCMQERSPHHMENEFTYPDGAVGQFELSIQPVPEGIFILSVDITERKRAEQALKESEVRFSTVFRVSPIGISITRLVDGRFVEVNDAFLSMFGYTREETIGHTSLELQVYGDPGERDLLVKMLHEQGRIHDIETQYRKKSGERGDLLVSAEIIALAGERFILSTMHDITDRKRADDHLRESEERYRGLFENMLEGFAYCKMIFEKGQAQDFVYLAVNDKFETLTGLKDVVGKRVTEVIPGIREADPELFEIYARVSLTGKPEKFEMFVAALKMWFAISVYSPEKEFFVAVFDVITERKRAEEKLRESEARFRTLFETMSQGVVHQDAAGQIIAANPAAERILGVTLDQMQGRTSLDPRWHAIHEDGTDFPGETHPAMMALSAGQVVRNVVMGVFNPKEGRHTWININAVPQFKPGEALPYQVYTTFEDISERKRAQDILQARLRLMEFGTAHSAKELLQATLDEAGALTTSPIGFYHFLAPDQETIILQAWSTRTRKEFCQAEEDRHYPVAEAGVWADCVRERRPIVHNDYATLAQRRGLPPGHAPITRELLVPVLRDHRIVAIVGVGNKPDPYTPVDLGILTSLADFSWDIVERKRAEEEQQKLVALVESSPNFTGLASLDGQVQFINQGGRALVGLNDTPVSELHISQFVPSANVAALDAIVETVRREGRWLGEGALRHFQTDEAIPVQIQTFLIPHPQTRQPFAIGTVMQDITERKRAETEIQRRSEQLAVLNDAALTIQQHLDPDQIYRMACEELRRFGTFASVYSINADGWLRHVHTAMSSELLADYVARFGDRPINPALPISTVPGATESLPGGVQVLNAKAIHRVLQEASLEGHPVIEWMFARAHQEPMLLAPLTQGDQTIGLLSVLGESLGEVDVPAVALFARQVSVALENAQLFAAEQARRAELAALYELARALAGTHALDETLHLIVRHAVETIRVTFARLALLENGRFVIRAAYPMRVLNCDLDAECEEPASQLELCQRVLTQFDPVVVYASDTALSPPVRQLLFLGIAKSACLVPLCAGDVTIGILILAEAREPEREPFKPEKCYLARAIGDQAAGAIRRVTLHAQTKRDALNLANAYDATIEGWSRALDLRDNETEGHTQRVTELTVRLARTFGFDAEQLVQVRRGALLHDIGKMGIPDAILLKPGTLNEQEWEIMRRHPDYAQMLLTPIHYLAPALDIPYCHHEKWDGTGYPRGLQGDQTPLAARLFAVVDVWDALTSNRPYRAAWPKARAREYICAQSGSHFDPQAVEQFLKLLDPG